MVRQSISITTPNDKWLKAQVESEEYSSKSEVINDLIRKARAQQNEIDYIRARLLRAENNGFTDKTAGDILAELKEEARRNGDL
ncbi:ribbon-helix-helix domain-containing protein [methane-oxidizing endosymbiont of Gigantopelta aegis]|uniref:ribbon-helix-helix domain-containing protein n=1 Tax=methane-oxidizing endosymbiont of Gigantopelta aegis TaxID=2794938 RepID=UPI0018DBB73B|nr:CopG family transcriptional regulator [methane-oxidizing endosymbiont of Gigantopelta aegis]